MISQRAFEAFKTLCQKNYKEVLSDEALFTVACNWLAGMDVVYRPIKKEWLEEYEREKAQYRSSKNININGII